jgi:hypothetical protein
MLPGLNDEDEAWVADRLVAQENKLARMLVDLVTRGPARAPDVRRGRGGAMTAPEPKAGDVEHSVRSMSQTDRLVYLYRRDWTWRWHQGSRYWSHPSRPGQLSTMAIAIREAAAEEMGVEWPPQALAPPSLRIVRRGPEPPAS